MAQLLRVMAQWLMGNGSFVEGVMSQCQRWWLKDKCMMAQWRMLDG